MLDEERDDSLGKESLNDSLKKRIDSICLCFGEQRLEKILETSCSQILATVQGEQLAQEIITEVKKKEAYQKIESLFKISCKKAEGTGEKRKELFGGGIKERSPKAGEYDIILEKR